MSTAPAIAANDLVVGYGAERVVEGITLSLQPGQALALVGTNGSGKSTLLKTLLGLIPSVGGSLEVLQASPGSRPKRIAYLRQAHGARFVVPIRAIEVVRMGRFASLGLLGRTSDRDRQLVRDAMAHMEITDLADQPLQSPTRPEGFAGPNDHWHQHIGLCVDNGWVVREQTSGPDACDGTYIAGGDFWMLHAWVVPRWDNRKGQFAPFNPKLCPPIVGTPDVNRCPD